MDNQATSTKLLPVDASKIGEPVPCREDLPWLEDWEFSAQKRSDDISNLELAARLLRTGVTPVAFPTETVYGLGADATRSTAVQGIYKTKQRPSDNPLIVHFCSLKQLRDVLRRRGSPRQEPSKKEDRASQSSADNLFNGHHKYYEGPIPAIYIPLIARHWPGPLTIILPNPRDSPLANEVTAGLSTFGARIPENWIALALIKLSGVPLAAPSANASGKPSPTTAEHVKEDLDGRIEIIIDGGPCSVGVESTVVDGLSDPPTILRPGGISIKQIQECPGWGNVVMGYKDHGEQLDAKPKAPGMKYRHYSPRAKVVLYEAGEQFPGLSELSTLLGRSTRIGVVRTKKWRALSYDHGAQGEPTRESADGATTRTNGQDSIPLAVTDQIGGRSPGSSTTSPESTSSASNFVAPSLQGNARLILLTPLVKNSQPDSNGPTSQIWDIYLGPTTSDIARGIFSALRNLDRRSVTLIFVEGISDSEDHLAAAIMNRLRKAATLIVDGNKNNKGILSRLKGLVDGGESDGVRT